MIFSKVKLKRYKHFVLEVIQAYLSQPAIECITQPVSLMGIFEPILELLKTCDDQDIIETILAMSRHLLKVLFQEKFEPTHVEEFLGLYENYMIVENLDIHKRKRLLKFKVFVQQFSKEFHHWDETTEEGGEEEGEAEGEGEESEGSRDGSVSTYQGDSILGLVVAPASFAKPKSSKTSGFEREYNLGERRRKTLEKSQEATEILRKIELEEQLRTSPNKLLSSSPIKGVRAADISHEVSKTVDQLNLGDFVGQAHQKVVVFLSESSSAIT